MNNRVISKDQPVKLSDGYRHERCSVCGDKIGYASFTAVKVDYTEVPYSADMIPVWELTHERCC